MLAAAAAAAAAATAAAATPLAVGSRGVSGAALAWAAPARAHGAPSLRRHQPPHLRRLRDTATSLHATGGGSGDADSDFDPRAAEQDGGYGDDDDPYARMLADSRSGLQDLRGAPGVLRRARGTTAKRVPLDQQPFNELSSLKEAPMFSWPQQVRE
jgi:hypothetical protein